MAGFPRAQANAHLYVLYGISKKMRTKLILVEDMAPNKRFKYPIDEIQALVLMSCPDIVNKDPYCTAVIQEISNPIFQHLLN